MTDPKENTAPAVAPKPQSKTAYYLEQIGQLLIALLVVFAIRSSIVEPFKIPSGSMIPTLFVGDFIFVNKFAYGFNLPFSGSLGLPRVTLVKRDPPQRGDIIVFRYPRDPSIHYIKRVIGIPGDTIELKDKVLYINGAMVPQSEVKSETEENTLKEVGDPRYAPENIRMFHEKVGAHDHTVMVDQNNEYTQNFGPIQVPQSHLFVMGDNRDFSNDSRFWGFVPLENVSGRAEVIWLSMWINFNDMDRSSFKPDRIGTVLQ